MEKRASLISLGISLFAMYLVYQYVDSEDQRLTELWGKENYFTMVVAARDILQYQTIKPSDIEVIQMPAALRPSGHIVNPRDVIDSVAAIPVSAGEYLLDNKIISKNVYSGLDTQIALGKRAISIPVTPKIGIGNLIQPGNRVDLAAHFEFKSKGKATSETKVFMQDMLVLATGKTIQTDPPKGVDQAVVRNVIDNADKSGARNLTEVRDTLNHAKKDANYQTLTLEVTPIQAQTIVYMMAAFPSSIIALLRNSDDRELARSGTTNLREIMGEDSYFVRSQRPKPPPPPKVPTYYDFVGDQENPVFK